MSAFQRLTITPPLLNTACPWASNLDDLRTLYKCPNTGAVTTRTATLNGCPDDPKLNQVAFTTDVVSSINSYGYSPHSLAQYIEWVGTVLKENVDSNKPIIISVTASLSATPHGTRTQSLDVSSQDEDTLDLDVPETKSNTNTELAEMIAAIQTLRKSLGDATSSSPRIAIELNTSCPNISDHPPPAYDPPSLRPLVEAISEAYFADTTLAVGLKLPPYVHSQQPVEVVDFLASFTKEVNGVKRNPISFLTCTNTLGMSLLYKSQTGGGSDDAGFPFAVPSTWGGLAGEHIHSISLGNVHAFAKLLQSHSDEAIRAIKIIGVGGVTTPEAAVRMIGAGASVVGCATILGRKGVGAFEELAKALQS